MTIEHDLREKRTNPKNNVGNHHVPLLFFYTNGDQQPMRISDLRLVILFQVESLNLKLYWY